MIELPLVPFSCAKPGEEMKRGWVWGVGWLGVFVVEAGKEKSQMPVARPGWAPGGRGTRGTASGSSPAHPSGFIPSQWVHPIPVGPSHPLGSVPSHGVRPTPSGPSHAMEAAGTLPPAWLGPGKADRPFYTSAA